MNKWEIKVQFPRSIKLSDTMSITLEFSIEFTLAAEKYKTIIYLTH